jgi:hypothetical protein
VHDSSGGCQKVGLWRSNRSRGEAVLLYDIVCFKIFKGHFGFLFERFMLVEGLLLGLSNLFDVLGGSERLVE